jgi:bifunctional DNA-binding transcriptional regulator/antitoxin component of YhaV-PrlF toxin-antitoxin module
MLNHNKKSGVSRKITKTGDYTYYVTIPREYIEALGWKCKQKVTVKLVGKSVVVKDWEG